MKATPEQPPERQKPPGQKTRYQSIIDIARAAPNEWFRVEGEHHSGNITTLKGHGLTVKSRRSTEDPRKHYLWVMFAAPDEERPPPTTTESQESVMTEHKCHCQEPARWFLRVVPVDEQGVMSAHATVYWSVCAEHVDEAATKLAAENDLSESNILMMRPEFRPEFA